jgi:predicted transcriptional regulator
VSLWAVLVIAGTVSGILGVILLLGGDAARLAVLAIPVAMYSRLRRERVLDHFLRGQVFEYIRVHPGATFSEIKRELGLATGTLVYHLSALEKAEFVRSERVGKWRVYHRTDQSGRPGATVFSALQKRILDLVGKEPGITQSGIAGQLGIRRQKVHYNLRKLRDAGLVSLRGWGPRKKCFVTVERTTVIPG